MANANSPSPPRWKDTGDSRHPVTTPDHDYNHKKATHDDEHLHRPADPHYTQRTALTALRDQLSEPSGSRSRPASRPGRPVVVLPRVLTPWLPLASAVCLALGIAAAIVVEQMLDTTEQILAQMPTTRPVSTNPHQKGGPQ
ncbi:hypothetical protein ACFWAY_38305 [Rhodococcus sp. NPDC059968]|uniref:hypothetical protein n=1 Tax=Rhodococcus sp. NPDC059968 TaxID=3347017 RepID=UPI00366D8A23